MHDTYLRGNHIYLTAILVFATVITVISAFLTYKNSIKAAEDSLNLQALGIAVSLETSLKDSKELSVMSDESRGKRNIFKEIITEGRWEGIAFIALYDKNSTTILHSNENLIGRPAQDRNLKKVIDTWIPSHTYITLGTDAQSCHHRPAYLLPCIRQYLRNFGLCKTILIAFFLLSIVSFRMPGRKLQRDTMRTLK